MAKKTVKKVVAKKAAEKVDMVNHPPHYKQHPSGVEAIEFIETMKTPTLASAAKYWIRKDLKEDTVQDLEKALWYVERELGRRLSPKKPKEIADLRAKVLKAERSKLLGMLLDADKNKSDKEALKKVIPILKRAISAAKKKQK